jgi:hypothetical protein
MPDRRCEPERAVQQAARIGILLERCRNRIPIAANLGGELRLLVVADAILRPSLSALGDVERDQQQRAGEPEPAEDLSSGLAVSAPATESEAEESGEAAEQRNPEKSDPCRR